MISTVPLLFVFQVSFFLIATARAAQHAQFSTTVWFGSVSLVLAMTAWAGASTWLALDGVYDAAAFLELLPGFWLPTVPFLVAAILAVALPSVRMALGAIATSTPAHWFVAVQALRISAVGTLYKTTTGQFPLHVELAIGLTDIAFGLSAIALYEPARKGRLSTGALAIWHLVGVMLIIIPGELAIQYGLPGPMQKFSTPPTSEVMLDLPMVLAPSLVVPLFLLLNLLAAFSARQAGANNASPSQRLSTSAKV